MRWFGNRRIYMDYAAATPVRKEALRAYASALTVFGNPGGLHTEGIEAAELLERSRKSIAGFLQCRSQEIFFTSGGTESNNIAIFGSVARVSHADVHVITTAIEHPSILEPVRELEKRGARVTRIAPDAHGNIRPEAIATALTPQTKLVSIGWANSEIGVVQPLHAIAHLIRSYEKERGIEIVFHTDAGQAPLYIKSTVHGLGVDCMTLDSGKLYGPRGIGALFIRRGVPIESVMLGGGQEGGIRPGTESHALAAGFATALEACAVERGEETQRLAALRSRCIESLSKTIPDAVVNGAPAKHALPHIVNISIPEIDAEYVALSLDHKGVAVSTKTSCRERERESTVVSALGFEPWRSHNTLRFSFGRETTTSEVDRAVHLLEESVRPRGRRP